MLTRRAFGAVLVAAFTGAFARSTFAEEVAVPVARQAALLVRVAPYDRNMAARAAGKVHVLIVTKPDDTDSRAVAAQMDAALRKFDRIAGLPYDVTTAPFAGGAQLAATCRANRIAIVYVAPGLNDAAIVDIARSLDGVDVLSTAALARFVDLGIVLGFDLVSGKPNLVIRLPQAKKQNVDIEAEVLHLMRVVR